MSLESMQKELVELVTQMKEAGADLVKQPPLFKWSYEEHPEVEFSLLIKERDDGPKIEVPDRQIVLPLQ
jgi:hypothetical protein